MKNVNATVENNESKDTNPDTDVNGIVEESLDSEMDMSINDDDFIQLFEQEPLWDTFAKHSSPNSPLRPDRSENNDFILEAMEDLEVAEDTNVDTIDLISDLGSLPECPEISIDDLPVFPKLLSIKWNSTQSDDVPDYLKTNSSQPQGTMTPPSAESSKAPTNGQRRSSTESKGRSFRQRNAIQLNPFTLEYARYKNLLGRSKLRPWSNTQNTTDDTQPPIDETIYSQYVPPTEAPRIGVPKRTSVPSKGPSKKTNPKPSERIFLTEELPDVTKYGLDKLILPPLQEETRKQKDKLITFKKKRKSKQHRSGARKIPRLQEPLKNDIFAFDANPQSIFRTASMKGKSKDTGSNDPKDTDWDEDSDSDELLNVKRKKKKHVIFDSDEESSGGDSSADEIVELTKEQLDNIFNFPPKTPSTHNNSRRLERVITDDGSVPIVADEFEYKDPKRPPIKLREIEKQKVLKSVLPHSFLKIYGKQILEEADDKHSAHKKHRTKPSSKPSSSKSSDKDQEITAARSIDDVFADFQDSDDEDSAMAEANGSVSPDEYVIRDENRSRAPVKSTSHGGQRQYRPNVIEQNQKEADVLPTSSENSSTQPRRTYSNKYPLHEAMEYNRIRTLYSHKSKRPGRRKGYQKKNSASSHKQNRAANTSSSKIDSIHMQVQGESHESNQMIDFFHDDEGSDGIDESDHFEQYTRDDMDGMNQIGEYGDDFEELRNDDPHNGVTNNPETTPNGEQKKRDKIIGENGSFTYYYKYPSHEIKPTEIREDKRSEERKLPPLQAISKRIRSLYGCHVKNMQDTVYLHKQLLAPLLSHGSKQAYAHVRGDYEHLEFFNTHFLWTDIVPKESELIQSLFYQMSKELRSACEEWWNMNENDDLPDHDRFYGFISVCLTLWIPCVPESSRESLVDLFMIHVRNLAWLVSKIVHGKPRSELPWRILIKLSIYILDWTCRLQQLGVHPMDWSVVEYTQIFLDILIYCGNEYLKLKSKQYLVEAWVCLVQILSISSRNNEFGLNEFVFIKQLKASIEKTVGEAENQEVEIRKCTEMWIDSLNYILDNHMVA